MQYNNDIFYSKPYYYLIKEESIESIKLYHKFINWTSGEFDLYLQDESMGLKVYFPNGWFSIGNFVNKEDQVNIEIKVKAKSSIVCQKMMIQLEHIYNHVVRFTELKVNQL